MQLDGSSSTQQRFDDLKIFVPRFDELARTLLEFH